MTGDGQVRRFFFFENSRKSLCAGHDRLIATNNKLKVGAHRERFFSSSSSSKTN
jgi:hypothetical protein